MGEQFDRQGLDVQAGRIVQLVETHVHQFMGKLLEESAAALGVQETAQVENIIKTLKEQGEPLILISHNMRQVFDLVDRIVVFRRGRMVADLNKSETDGQDVVAYITGAKTQPQFEGSA